MSNQIAISTNNSDWNRSNDRDVIAYGVARENQAIRIQRHRNISIIEAKRLNARHRVDVIIDRICDPDR